MTSSPPLPCVSVSIVVYLLLTMEDVPCSNSENVVGWCRDGVRTGTAGYKHHDEEGACGTALLIGYGVGITEDMVYKQTHSICPTCALCPGDVNDHEYVVQVSIC